MAIDGKYHPDMRIELRRASATVATYNWRDEEYKFSHVSVEHANKLIAEAIAHSLTDGSELVKEL